MAIHPNEFCMQTGLMYDVKSRTFWGTLSNFSVFLQIVPRRDSMIFRLIAKPPQESDASAIRAALDAWQASHSGVSGIQYQDRTLATVISAAAKDTDAAAAALITELVMLADRLGLIPCCMSCGAEYGYRPYLLDNGGVAVCDMCRPHLEQQIEDVRTASEEQRPNYLGMIFGAVLGALIVLGLTYAVLDMHYLSALTGYAGLLIGLLTMKKLGKKLTLPGVLICTVLCAAAGCFATVLHFSNLIAEYNQENEKLATDTCVAYLDLKDVLDEATAEERQLYEAYAAESGTSLKELEERYEQSLIIRKYQTGGECFSDFFELIDYDVYSSVKPELVKCILYVLISVIGGAAATAPKLLIESNGIHTLRELSA